MKYFVVHRVESYGVIWTGKTFQTKEEARKYIKELKVRIKTKIKPKLFIDVVEV